MARVVKKIKVRIRRPTTIVLALSPNSKEGKPPHRICLDRHNTVFCTCKGWRYNGHTCVHLTEFRRQLASAQEQLK